MFADAVFGHKGAGPDADGVGLVIQGFLRSLTEDLKRPIELNRKRAERSDKSGNYRETEGFR